MTLFAVLKSAVANPSLKRPYTGANRSRACAMRRLSLHNRARLVAVRSSQEWAPRCFGGVRAAIFQNLHPLDAQDLCSAPARFTCLGAGDCFRSSQFLAQRAEQI